MKKAILEAESEKRPKKLKIKKKTVSRKAMSSKTSFNPVSRKDLKSSLHKYKQRASLTPRTAPKRKVKSKPRINSTSLSDFTPKILKSEKKTSSSKKDPRPAKATSLLSENKTPFASHDSIINQLYSMEKLLLLVRQHCERCPSFKKEVESLKLPFS